MREITDKRELQEIQLSILDKVHNFCLENNIRYSLYGGTLLGAIRHKGFIPWDDDIDILMPRPDYERFCREFKADGFSVHTHQNDKEYFYPFAKVEDCRTLLYEDGYPKLELGVNIDVFPLDGFPDNGKSLVSVLKKRKFWIRLAILRSAQLQRKTFFRIIVNFFLKLILRAVPLSAIVAVSCYLVKRYGYDGCPYVANLSWGYGTKECFRASDAKEFIDVDFEGRKFKSVSGWHAYLTGVFGDYMQLPPLEKRKSHHHFRAWWK